VQSFKLTEINRSDGCHEIRVGGELDLAVADQLEKCIDSVGPEHDVILVNLENCEFIDSTGIALIVAAHRRRAEQGQRLAVCAPSNQVHRILSVTGLMDNGLVFEDAREALAGPS
jgi:anti-sigma B factor antagonist